MYIILFNFKNLSVVAENIIDGKRFFKTLKNVFFIFMFNFATVAVGKEEMC